MVSVAMHPSPYMYRPVEHSGQQAITRSLRRSLVLQTQKLEFPALSDSILMLENDTDRRNTEVYLHYDVSSKGR